MRKYQKIMPEKGHSAESSIEQQSGRVDSSGASSDLKKIEISEPIHSQQEVKGTASEGITAVIQEARERAERISERKTEETSTGGSSFVDRIASRYSASPTPESFGESLFTSGSYFKDRKEGFSTLKAVERLACRVGTMAETGDTDVFRKDIDPHSVSIKTKLRGLAILTLSTPAIFVQALGTNNPLLRKMVGLFDPSRFGLITKKFFETYEQPFRFRSGTFDAEGNLVKEDKK